MKRIAILTVIMALTVTVIGCKAANTPLPTGAINATDAQLNANLQAAHAALVQYQADVVAGKFTPDPTTTIIVNKIIVALNTADALYCAPVNGACSPTSYPAQLMANPAAGEPAQLAAAMTTIETNIGAIESLVQAVK